MLSFLKRFTSASPTGPVRVADPLDQVLMHFDEGAPFTIRDACEGVQIFGGIGSGKTSGSGANLAMSYLEAGFGGLVLTAKPDETQRWCAYAHAAGRIADLLIVGLDRSYHFNAIRYELERGGTGASETENVVGLFDTLTEVATRGGGGRGGENEAFWRAEQRKLVRNAVDLLRLALHEVTLPSIYAVIRSAPQSLDDLTDADWREKSDCYLAILDAGERHEKHQLSEREERDHWLTHDYWTREFPTMAEKTRSTVVSVFTGMADALLRGAIRDLFSEDTTFTPEASFDGKIIILDLAIKDHRETGHLAQVLFKYCWQRSVESRRTTAQSRPVFLWADEAQYFVNEQDVSFQTTARSSRVCTVLLTQNLPNYHFALGGERNRALVDSLLGNLVTKIFHNNTCAATNRYAAELFAQDWQEKASHSRSLQGTQLGHSESVSSSLQYTVQPREFSGLRKGGPENDFIVEAIIHQGGKVFPSTGTNALLTGFRQR